MTGSHEGPNVSGRSLVATGNERRDSQIIRVGKPMGMGKLESLVRRRKARNMLHFPLTTVHGRRQSHQTCTKRHIEVKGRSGPDEAPARRKSGAECGAHENVVVEIPNRCLTGAGVVKEIIGVAVAVKVSHSH